MQKAKRGVFAYFGMDLVMGMTKLRVAELINTSAWPPAALEAEFWMFWKNDFVPFQDLLSLFQAVFTLLLRNNRALDTNGEAVHRQHRLQVQQAGHGTKKQSCDSASGQKGQTTAIFEEAAVCYLRIGLGERTSTRVMKCKSFEKF